MRCGECVRIDLEKRQRMAAAGFGSCKFDGLGVYKSLTWTRECSRYAKATPEVIEARQAKQTTTGSGQE